MKKYKCEIMFGIVILGYLAINFPIWLSRLADIATIIGIVGVFIAIRAFRHTIKYEQQQAEETKLLRSIRLVTACNNTLIDLINKYNENYQTEFEQRINNFRQLNPKHTGQINERLIANNLKLNEFRVGEIINQIELIAIYVTSDLCNEEIIKDKFATVIVSFCENEMPLITDLENKNHNYLEIKQLISQWGGY